MESHIPDIIIYVALYRQISKFYIFIALTFSLVICIVKFLENQEAQWSIFS